MADLWRPQLTRLHDDHDYEFRALLSMSAGGSANRTRDVRPENETQADFRFAPGKRFGIATPKDRISPKWAMMRRPAKTSEIVALGIVRHLVSRDLRPGDRLPLEAEMAVQYRVSRSSLREALRLLEVQGLIAIRPGTGAVVGRVLPGNLARTLTLYLHMLGSTYDELLDAWMAAEPMLARLAAANPNRDRVCKALTPFLPEGHGGDPAVWSLDTGLDFHERVAQLAESPVLALILQSIGCIVTEQVLSVTERDQLEQRIVHDHGLLAQAIIEGDPDRAGQIMADHAKHVAEDFKAYWPRKLGERVQWSEGF